jgi:hypothetical protein
MDVLLLLLLTVCQPLFCKDLIIIVNFLKIRTEKKLIKFIFFDRIHQSFQFFEVNYR